MKLRGHLTPVALVVSALIISAPARADDLLGLYREAVQADATWLAAQAANRAQREVGPQALARLLPDVSFSGTAFKNKADGENKYTDPPGTPYDVDNKYNSHEYRLGLRQPVFRPALIMAYQQAQAQVQSIDATLDAAEQEVGTRVGEAYFKVLQAESELEVTKAQRDAYLTQLDYAQKAFQHGAGTRTDIDEARSQLDLAAAQTIQLQYQLNYQRDALQAIVGRPLTPLARLSPELMRLEAPTPNDFNAWVKMAEEVNPELIAARAAVDAAERKIKAELSGHLPTVDFVAQRSKAKGTSSGPDYTYETDQKSTLYGVQFDLPIFSGGGQMSAVRQAGAERDKALQQMEATRRDIGLRIRKAFDGVAQGVNWVHAYEQAVRSAEQALLSTRKGFIAGTRTTLDILTAEQNLATARRDLNKGRFEYLLSKLQLMALVGKLDEGEIGRFNGWLVAR
ncbi:MAG: TolC family outer membrane protein [Azoarcus sp.]|jgi:outer membrane protein/protease secretion system outer membrane protein|nr:TolC family outer membrane protein [Azoarcus sp.]